MAKKAKKTEQTSAIEAHMDKIAKTELSPLPVVNPIEKEMAIDKANYAVDVHPIDKVVSGMVELTANNGSLNKYGKRNLIRHGRHAQGGQIDQQVFKSFLTGKPVSFEDCCKLVLTESVSNPLTPSRIDAHLQHLVGNHGFKILINPTAKSFQCTGVGDIKKEDIKAACDIL